MSLQLSSSSTPQEFCPLDKLHTSVPYPKLLRAACSWEDWVYNLTRPVKTLRVERADCSEQQRWQARTPAMAAGLTDHIWTIKELLTTVVIPTTINT